MFIGLPSKMADELFLIIVLFVSGWNIIIGITRAELPRFVIAVSVFIISVFLFRRRKYSIL